MQIVLSVSSLKRFVVVILDIIRLKISEGELHMNIIEKVSKK